MLESEKKRYCPGLFLRCMKDGHALGDRLYSFIIFLELADEMDGSRWQTHDG